MQHEDIAAYFAAQGEWTEQLLDGLLRIRSESGVEADAIGYMQQRLMTLGVECELVPLHDSIKDSSEYSSPQKGISYEGRCNISASVQGAGGKTIALNSHVDVVPPSPGQVDPYLPHKDAEGYICARGACDAKGQIAAMALLLKAAVELPKLNNSIVCHMVVEEELGGNGTLGMLEAKPAFSADALINMEPTDLQLQTSIRGAVWFDMTFKGASGHAGSAGNTQSAVYKAMAAVELLRTYHGQLYQRSKDYGLFKGLSNPMPLTIGEFHAGVWPSMVPGEARISGVIGLLPNITKQQVMEEIRKLFNSQENRWLSDGMEIAFTYRHNAVELPTDHWVAKGMSSALEDAGLCGTMRPMTASTDAVYYDERGIPSFAFGPGKISDAHSCHERVKLEDILKAAEAAYRFILNA